MDTLDGREFPISAGTLFGSVLAASTHRLVVRAVG
jgi:hypothetical protein